MESIHYSGSSKGALWEIINAHDDDVHVIIKTSDQKLLTGSKDSSIKSWDFKKEETCELDRRASETDYRFWVTALAADAEGRIISGWRDGKVKIRYQDGYCKIIDLKGKADHLCKERNVHRINCLTPYADHYCFAGTAQLLKTVDLKNSRVVNQTKICDNDWIYCVTPLTDRDIAVVYGSDLQIFTRDSDDLSRPNWHLKSHVIKEERKSRDRHQRPFLSYVEVLDDERQKLAIACFDGSIKIVDLENHDIESNTHAHVGRVWAVIKLNDSLIASSAEDKTVKIWDVKQRTLVKTLKGFPGRVSGLQKMDDELFVAASCPDKPHESEERAELSGWDLRMLKDQTVK